MAKQKSRAPSAQQPIYGDGQWSLSGTTVLGCMQSAIRGMAHEIVGKTLCDMLDFDQRNNSNEIETKQ